MASQRSSGNKVQNDSSDEDVSASDQDSFHGTSLSSFLQKAFYEQVRVVCFFFY